MIVPKISRMSNTPRKVDNVKTIHAVYNKIAEVLQQARSKAYTAVNVAMIEAYWNIGRIIVEEEQQGKNRAAYGKGLLEELSLQLSREYGDGFTETNLKYMRQFYQTFPIRHAVRDELSWTHYRLLLKVDKEKARNFYITECIENSWSTRQLERQMASHFYERHALL